MTLNSRLVRMIDWDTQKLGDLADYVKHKKGCAVCECMNVIIIIERITKGRGALILKNNIIKYDIDVL